MAGDVKLPICEKFENAVYAVLENCPAGTNFLVAVSGGADSIAMLTALHQLLTKNLPAKGSTISKQSGSSHLSTFNFQLSTIFCLHVEHGLRPAEESSADAEFVRGFCAKYEIKCKIVTIPAGKIAAFAKRKGIGIEAAARFFRHKALGLQAAKLGENTRILIGHTKDDMLETSLMRVLRGSGSAGLAAMPERRGRLVRPLINLTREDVIGYLTAKGINWREDATNADEMFLRNKIRQRLVPLLDDCFPSWRAGISSMAQTQSLVTDFIEREAETRIKWDLGKGTSPSGSFSVNAENFFAQPQILREEALFQVIDKLLNNKQNLKSVKRAVIRQFCNGTLTSADLGAVRVKRDSENIVVLPAPQEYFERGVSRLV
ncbi:MAG: tRNA lysidine(34) synthetase TilS [Treponema sp.]|nr:tRNA lysidine(34) synthetase TilS [Treponema sp.]